MTPADPDQVRSLEDGPEIELTIKGSRFLGQAFRAPDEAAAGAALARTRRAYHDATHHCWAGRLGLDEPWLERWDDNGEPSGTAGVPIIGAIRHDGLTQVLIVVTRYYGGTKLGTGGLVRAYGEAARLALAAAPRIILWREACLTVAAEYDDLGIVETILGKQAGVLLEIERSFEPSPRFRLRVKRSRIEGLRLDLTEATRGRVRIENG